MTVEYPPRLRDLTEFWRALLIPGWEVTLMPNAFAGTAEGPEGSQGQSQTNSTYATVLVWLNLERHETLHGTGQAYWDGLEETLVHELLHAALDDVVEASQPAVDEVGRDARGLIKQAREQALERLLDSLARVLVALAHGKPGPILVKDGRPGHAGEQD